VIASGHILNDYQQLYACGKMALREGDMDPVEKQRMIQRIAYENQYDVLGERVLWSRHATAKLVDYSLRRADVETALARCLLIEDYLPLHRPLPDCLVLGTLPSGSPFHAVIAIDEANRRIFVVTIYLPARERWQDDWQTRK
ncbi:DUF4258 domain-containing protein, partial [Candidatus Amarolinea dominans]|uniref:DUF4258 domain-containing protein n=1 Tax=Candidatus Amarolinea dominans TaxID=3140696 RepID=UPI0031CC544D